MGKKSRQSKKQSSEENGKPPAEEKEHAKVPNLAEATVASSDSEEKKNEEVEANLSLAVDVDMHKKTTLVGGNEDVAKPSVDHAVDPDDMDDVLTIEDQREEKAAKIGTVLSGVDRNKLFAKAESLLSKQQLDLALSAYLRCIKGLERGCGFLYLPQCLHQIAEVYHRKEEDDKAIQFLKAEKIYYETALIDSKEVQEKLEKVVEDTIETSGETETESDNKTSLRASEYESLARLCLQKQQYELALEFCGKATLLYQQHYGDNNPVTQRSLDLLTSVYAEVGKREYEDKINQYSSESSPARDHTSSNDTDGLRNRRGKSANKTQKKSATVTADSTTAPADPNASDNSGVPLGSTLRCEVAWYQTERFLLICVVVLSLLAILLFSFSYCRVTRTSWACHYVRVQSRKLLQLAEFTYYKWTTPATPA